MKLKCTIPGKIYKLIISSKQNTNWRKLREVLWSKLLVNTYVYTTSGGWEYYVILMVKYFPNHFIFIPVILEISINCSSGKSSKLPRCLDLKAMANILKPRFINTKALNTYPSLKMAAIANTKEKYTSEWNSGPSLWIKICIFQQGLTTQIFQGTDF